MRRAATGDRYRWSSIDRVRGRAGAARPGAHRGLRGLERRRRGGDGRGRAPRGGLGRRAVAALDPEDYYDFQVNRPRSCADDGGSAGSPGRPPGSSSRPHRARTATSSSCRASSRRCAGGRSPSSCSSVVAAARRQDRRHPRRAPRRRPAHPPDAGHRPRPTTTDARHRLDLEPSRYEGPTGIVGVLTGRARPGRAPVGLVLGRGAALRRAAAVARRPRWRCCAASRTCST